MRVRGMTILLGLFAMARFCPAQTVPAVPWTDVPPAVDGKLDDAAWSRALRLENFRVFRTDSAPEDRTTVFLVEDGRWFYVGFRCEDTKAKDIAAAVPDRDASVHADDSIEVFLDPGSGRKRYLHFLMNAAGIMADQIVNMTADGPRTERSWNAPSRSAARVESWGWSGEFAVPLYAILQQRAGTAWTFNIARNQRTRPDRTYLTLAPVTKGFHDPEKFLPIQPLTEVKAPYAPLLKAATVSG